MPTIKNILDKYYNKLDSLDLDLIISRAINKPREFVLAHPEKKITKKQKTIINKLIVRRLKSEPMAYILGEKEFYGLDFKINKNALIPRPETELLIEEVLKELKNKNKKLRTTIIDIGTGSGNIIISLAKIWTSDVQKELYGIDTSQKALKIARYNAKKHKVDKKIKFLHGNMLKPILNSTNYKLKTKNCLIIANLPYVSSQNYKKYKNQLRYEPKSALLSDNNGLNHNKKLFCQIKKLLAACYLLHATCIIEFSPEQKNKLNRMVKSYFPGAKIEFKKDLAGKWRVCNIKI